MAPVEVREAQYSQSELEAAAAKIDAVKNNTNLNGIRIPVDGSGLVVERFAADTALRAVARTGRPLVDVAEAVAQIDLGVSVAVVQAGSALNITPCANNICRRTDDKAWWNGGGYIKVSHYVGGPTIATCTSGFAVWNGEIHQDYDSFILTAAHCMTPPDIVRDGASELIGQAWLQSWRHDLILTNARGWYWMWDGSPTTTFHKTVHSWGFHDSGEWLCLSGAASGIVCDLETQPWHYYNIYMENPDSDGDCCYYVEDMAIACVPGNTTAARSGDSGGPVFSLDGDGVRAKGIVSGVTTKPFGSTPSCVVYQDMDDIVNGNPYWIGVTPATN